MTRRIDEDHKRFRDVISGKIHQELGKYIQSGEIIKAIRGQKNGKIVISTKRINLPSIIYGDSDAGVGRGKGNPGDVIAEDDPGTGKGTPGDEHKDGMLVQLDLEEVFMFMQDELELPRLKPKDSEVFDQIKIKYNNISLVGPESLRHTRRTMIEALKRQAADGSINTLHKVPGCRQPIPLLIPINKDKRYRMFKEIRYPSSNALVIFARDSSGSMDTEKCEIISDMAWWIDLWVRRFYTKVERLYVCHDTVANELNEETWYRYRDGGGTRCSCALRYISEQFENRYSPQKWNIYLFYFTDGDNYPGDNEIFIQLLHDNFGPDRVNFVGITEVLCNYQGGDLKSAVDSALEDGRLSNEVIRTVGIGPEANGSGVFLSEEGKNSQMLKAIKALMGAKKEN